MKCDYCGKDCNYNDDKKVENYIPELGYIYCDQCLLDYDKGAIEPTPVSDGQEGYDQENKKRRLQWLLQ